MRDGESIRIIVRRAQAGDRDAFSVLQTLHEWRLKAFLRLRIGRVLARYVTLEDAAQDVWVCALASIRRFEWQGKGSFHRWLSGIADNVIKSHARRHLGSPRAGECSLELTRDDGERVLITEDRRLGRKGTTPSRALRREERLERLAGALEKLLPDHREVILLARIRGLRIVEVAQRMKRTPQAVRSLLWRALAELRREFGDTDSLGLPERSVEPFSAAGTDWKIPEKSGDRSPPSGFPDESREQ